MRLALSTPTKFLIENKDSTFIEKKCLHDLFIKNIQLKHLSKSGFAGFPNETIEFLGEVDKWNVWDLLRLKKNFEELKRRHGTYQYRMVFKKSLIINICIQKFILF